MLKARVLTAVVLVPLVLWLVWGGSTWALGAVVVAVMTVAGWEWSALTGLRRPLWRAAYALGCGVACTAVWAYLASAGLSVPLLVAAGLWWLLPVVRLAAYIRMRGALRARPLLEAVSGPLTVAAAAVAILSLHLHAPAGPLWLTLLLLLVWGADIGGYFAGRGWGRCRLAPTVSPGKTWEGVFGGVLLALGAAAATLGAAHGLGMSPVIPWASGLLVVALTTIAAGVLGDLFESMLKRQHGLKDSGQLLPGHGGLLDRIDALLAAAPVFGLLAFLIGGAGDA